jgi:hypothetical protein
MDDEKEQKAAELKAAERRGDVIVANDVEAKPVEWLWRERIPKGFISVIAGRPDQGKGLFGAHVAAEVTARGQNVLYSAVEDDHGLMTRPRLEAAGAVLNRVLLWRFTLPVQFDELTAHVTDSDIKLVVMDPFTAHLAGVSRHSDSIRKVTTPLSQLAEDTGCAILVVEHALKRVPKNSDPLSAIGGNSSGLPAASRVAFLFGRDPDDADRRVLATIKCNISERPKALSFETDTESIGLVGEIPFLMNKGEVEIDPKRLLGDGTDENKVGRRPEKRAAASEWLATRMMAKGGKPIPAKDILADAKDAKITGKTIRRAADDMGITRNPPHGGPGCTWELPSDLKKALKKQMTGKKGGS